MAISTTSYSPNGWVTIAGTSYRFKRYSGGGGDYTDCLTFTGETSEFTLKATNKEWDGTLEWSTDHTNWTTLTGTEAMQSVGKKLYLRGKDNTTFYTSQGVRWQLSARAGCSGNIQTLLDWENPPTSILTTNCYSYMFMGCTNLTTAPELSATGLHISCYSNMFRGCTSLTTAPALPATTLAYSCYFNIFYGCTSLTKAPVLPATTLADFCYDSMFRDCTSLTTAPSLPATTLASYCYNGMFNGCTKLKLSTTQTTEYKTPWRIPSSGTISGESSGWNTDMLANTGGTFTGNPSINTTYYGAWGTSGGGDDYTDCLTFTGETSEFTLAVGSKGAKEWDGTLYYSTDHNTWNVWDGTAINSANKKLYLKGKGNTMFYDLTGARLSLSAKASCSGNIQTLLDWESPPTSISTGHCYTSMFNGCTNLTTAPALPATMLANYCYHNMFDGCTSLTTAPVLPATTLADSCYSGMFYGCTNLTTAPVLPATKLVYSCYSYIFYGCTNLTTAPVLPATTLAESCYSYMFDGCTSLTSAPALPATTLANDCYSGMFEGCTNLTTAPNLPATTLANDCYNRMFNGCTKLKLSTTQTAEYKTPWRIPSSGTISSEPSNWNTDMLTGTGGTFTGNPSINTTYYGA